jgi:geranylgeranyl pyrophosphate synthase
MDDTVLKNSLLDEVKDFDSYLKMSFDSFEGIPDRLKSAMGHSLFGGGKRIRPILALWTYDSFVKSSNCSDRNNVQIAGVALEMMHTYSLIHDDLPAMDDDDLRRSLPTCHIKFGEATAILAGDGLQSLAFEIMAGIPNCGASLVADLASSVGPAGMVGGQQLDLDNEGQELFEGLIKDIHLLKTANLIAASMSIGARIAGIEKHKIPLIKSAGISLGMAFQAADDILDVMSDSATLGKTVGKDEKSDKPTWVRFEGLDKARHRMLDYGQSSINQMQALLPNNDSSSKLLKLMEKLWIRDR